jgi:ABC transporter DrrB family efflux protein
MTTATTELVRPGAAGSGAGWWLSDAWLMLLRTLRHMARTPQLMLYWLFQPILFILLFAYVFGGAIQVPEGNYRQFLMPGIFVQMIFFNSVAAPAVGLAEDLQKGITDRFRSLPMTRSSVLLGRNLAEVIRNAVSLLVMIAAAVAIGFRFNGSAAQVLGGVALLLLFGFAFTWVSALIGLASGTAEAANAFGFIWLPFIFVSSAFVPVESMPGWMQAYAEHSPITVTVNTLRAWFNGQPASSQAGQALAWCIGVLVVFLPLAVRKYQNATAK